MGNLNTPKNQTECFYLPHFPTLIPTTARSIDASQGEKLYWLAGFSAGYVRARLRSSRVASGGAQRGKGKGVAPPKKGADGGTGRCTSEAKGRVTDFIS